jgi:competence protein ComEC
MSIAAQLATLPLGLYYFHQFPVYFIAANLIIIPLSVLCIWGGMLLLVVSWIPMVNTGVGFLLNYMLQALNYLAVFSEKLPNATWSNFKLNKIEVAAMFLIIGVILVALKSAKKQWLYAGLASVVVFMGCRVYQKADSLNQQKLIVYQVNKASAVEVINGSQSLLMADTTCVPGSINYKFNIDAAQWFFDIKNRSINTPSPLAYNNPPLLVAGNKTVLLYTPKFNPGYTSINGKIDYVLVSGTPYLDYAFITKLNPKMVVFDGSNKPSKLKYWTKKLDQLHIPYHNTAVQGAWVADLN